MTKAIGMTVEAQKIDIFLISLGVLSGGPAPLEKPRKATKIQTYRL